MDIGDIRTPFLIDGFCFKITSQDIYLIIRDSPMVCIVVILFYHYRPQPLFCHMPLDTLYAAGCPIAIEGTAYFDGAIPPF